MAVVTTVRKEMTISASHHLPKHKAPDGSPGKCSRPHGHNYKIEVFASGPIDDNGMVVDFYQLSVWMHTTIHQVCDHQDLNKIFPGMDTTAENLAGEWLQQLRTFSPLIDCVRVWETDGAYAQAEWVASESGSYFPEELGF